MKGVGVGGPLLCIADLLHDVGESAADIHIPTTLLVSSTTFPDQHPSSLTTLFQENYDQLKEAVDGTDHSWTALTLKLCTALDTADKLVQSTNSHVGLLKNNIKELEKVIKRGDSVVAAATSIYKT